MSQATAIAHPNIALVKYWGKRDLERNLPAVSSLSLTLDGFATRTTVTTGTAADEVLQDGKAASPGFASRALAFLDRMLPGREPLRIETANNFPTGAGLASSASGFAALTVAAASAAGASLDPTHLSRWARLGSGSACRSLWGGFVAWHRGVADDGSDSHGVPVAGPGHWDLVMVVAVVATGPKSVGSTEGMERSRKTSPYFAAWVDNAEADVAEAQEAVRSRDLERLGTVMEHSTLKMHATMHTASPPLLYWQPATLACLQTVAALRADGTSAWATMDAGPQVKVLCARSDAERVSQALRPHALQIHTLGPGPGVTLEAP